MTVNPNDEHFYSLHVCGPDQEGGISVKTSGYEGDIHYTGKHQVSQDSPDIDVWRWVHENRQSFPPIIPQELFSGIVQTFRNGPPVPQVPPNGFYLVSAASIGPAVAAQKALEFANTTTPLPRPLHILDTDSDEPSQRFPQLLGLLHGWGELFGFADGQCDLYLPLGKDLEALDRRI